MTTEDSKLATKLRQVQALLDRAEHPNTPPAEAESARAMAEKLMAKYRLEEEHLRQTAMAKGVESIKPIVDEFPMCDASSQYMEQYVGLMYECIYHVGNIRMAYRYQNGQQVGFMVGFESDVKYAQTLYTALRLHFSNTLEPKVDSSLSDQDNVYNLRTAGIERIRIGEMLWGPGKHGAKVTRLYEAACKARGEDPKVVGRSVNVKTYRESFARSYVGRISDRLWSMRQSAGMDSAAMELAGRKGAVEEAFYERFPHLRPSNRPGLPGPSAGPFGNCAKCKKAKSGYCKEHSYLRPRVNKTKTSYLGMAMGERAADSADLGGDGPRNNKLEA